ncbi:type II toxin-antitoxin system ParD family antitoxin [Ciceribacter sp. RN22]|uniref:type II toxin-antitoxin system ParD family antitoxin n=1 Tax=Ciceribacter sp. RN22 TaxID=2954932 RepID=UPI00209276D3|nr:type II toxin-antitoxin system ParD family antitoxin [Ciceribacter sp. RN22]MCO6179044.1 type II toxin-antitoxin system ParD family antitoxin [Ciceribacter sp. RN22]
MRTTRSLSITLPLEMAEMVKAKVASGEYATESEVVRDGLRTLAARDAALDAWLRDEVVSTYDRYKANPEKAAPIDNAFRRVQARLDAVDKGNS